MTLVTDREICAYLEGAFEARFGSQSYYSPGGILDPAINVISARTPSDPATNIIAALFKSDTDDG